MRSHFISGLHFVASFLLHRYDLSTMLLCTSTLLLFYVCRFRLLKFHANGGDNEDHSLGHSIRERDNRWQRNHINAWLRRFHRRKNLGNPSFYFSGPCYEDFTLRQSYQYLPAYEVLIGYMPVRGPRRIWRLCFGDAGQECTGSVRDCADGCCGSSKLGFWRWPLVCRLRIRRICLLYRF